MGTSIYSLPSGDGQETKFNTCWVKVCGWR